MIKWGMRGMGKRREGEKEIDNFKELISFGSKKKLVPYNLTQFEPKICCFSIKRGRKL